MSEPNLPNRHKQAIYHFSLYEWSTTSLESGYLPLQASCNEAKSPALFMTSPGVASMKPSPRSPTKRKCISEILIKGHRLHPSGTPQVRPHLPQQIRSIRCLHPHLGPPRRHTVSILPCAKSHTRRRPTLRVPPFNIHWVCGIRRLILRYYRDSQGLHT